MKSIKEVMICWTGKYEFLRDQPKFGQVALIPWPDKVGASDHFMNSAGACDFKIQEFTRVQRQHFVLSTAYGMLVNQKMDPAVVHAALWPLKEYRDALPPDTPSPDGKAVAAPGVW